MKKASSLAILVVMMMVMVLANQAQVSQAAGNCNPSSLSSCLPAITGGARPSADCCSKMKQQAPCFCTYVRNPSFSPYISSPNARKTVQACGVAFPKC
ncbi:hypothetical protein Tsubulata_008927 [Turnera subulata]|uniref:Bifunctional inhibitor/plant lipid transfer protein/seed storage helical domain-containing protein n=1 Tax=Turnera subulata TaxID=218843 RepID=A0A9Q0IX04_9ROSI|nr:hypothetical protein Tsubulata_008927 [Turnera subulata]